MRRAILAAVAGAVCLTGCEPAPDVPDELAAPEILGEEHVDQPTEIANDDGSKGERPFGDVEWEPDKRAWVGTVPRWEVEYRAVEGADGYVILLNDEFRGDHGGDFPSPVSIPYEHVAEGDTLTVVAYAVGLERDRVSHNPLEWAAAVSEPSEPVTFAEP